MATVISLPLNTWIMSLDAEGGDSQEVNEANKANEANEAIKANKANDINDTNDAAGGSQELRQRLCSVHVLVKWQSSIANRHL